MRWHDQHPDETITNCKYMKPLFFFFLLNLSFFACTPKLTQLPTATYFGSLPCADCSGILMELQLNSDGSYKRKMQYKGKSGQVFTEEGSFSIRESREIWLENLPNQSGMNRFKLEKRGEKIRLIDLNGQPIRSKQYVLISQKPENFTMEEQNSFQPNFKAMGNEPFWSIEIAFGKTLLFKRLANPTQTLEFSFPNQLKLDKKMTLSNGEETLELLIQKEKCQHSMAGEVFSYQVTAILQKSDSQKLNEFMGCGRYLGDYRLNDIWVLQSIDGKAVSRKNRLPQLDLQMVGQKLFGFGGCNRLSGKFSVTDGTLTLGPLAATKMACKNDDLEPRFLAALNNGPFDYQIGNNSLTLTSENHQLVFKKID